MIYPEAYCDGNDDGIGDLKGIISKLDYLKELGIDLIWICPFFDSPLDDGGYDVRDYYKVNPRYGDNEELKALIQGCHERGIHILVDFVMNHTSEEHPWFRKALEDPGSEERGYYYFRKGRIVDGKLLPPNNWKGFFSTSAWENIPGTDEFYLHLFSKKMPDVNWGNPALREKYYEIAKWYLDLGVDGFRLDAISHLGKDLSFSDSTLPLDQDGMVLDTSKFANREEMYVYLNEFKEKVLSHYPCLSLGEAGGGISPEQSLRLTDIDNGSIDMVFNFDCSWCNGAYGSIDKKDEEIRTNVLDLKRNFKRWYDITAGRSSSLPPYLCNHDHPRALSQYGDIRYRKESGKMVLLTILFQYGTPFILYGDEIGMSNVTYSKPEDFYSDVSAKNAAQYFRNLGYSEEQITHYLCRCSRVNGRQPMQWGRGENASFSCKTPINKTNLNYLDGVNVEDELLDEDSILNFAKLAIKERKKPENTFYIDNGEFVLPNNYDPNVFAFAYLYEGKGIAVISNFRSTNLEFDFELIPTRYVLGNYPLSGPLPRRMVLRPFETMLLEVREHE